MSCMYLTCDALKNKLCFFGRKVSFCSNGNPLKLRQYPILYENFDGELDINDMMQKIEDTRKNIVNGILPDSCQGCGCLEKVNKNEEDNSLSYRSPLKYIQFSDYGLCNSKCIYCNSWTNTICINGEYVTKDNSRDSYNIMPIIEKMIEQKLLTKDTTIDFAGGEPTLYEHFEEALNYLITFGVKKILIFSNIIKYSEAIASGISSGSVTLTVSVDAGTKNIHKKIKGVESFDTIYKNMELYIKQCKNKNQVISKYVIVPNIND